MFSRRKRFVLVVLVFVALSFLTMALAGYKTRNDEPPTAEELLTGNYYAFYRGSNFEESISIEYGNREYTSIQIADFPYGLKEKDTAQISKYAILGCIDLDDENALFHYVLCCTEDTEQEYLLLIPDPKLGNKKTLFEAKQPLAFCVKADFS